MLHAQTPQSSFGGFGGMEAADFLGLSQELAGVAPVAAEDAATPSALPAEAPAPEADNSASWLLSLDEQHEATESELEPALAAEETAVPERRSFGFGSLAAAGLIIGAAVVIAMKFGVGKDASTPAEPIAHTQPRTHATPTQPRGGASDPAHPVPSGTATSTATNPEPVTTTSTPEVAVTSEPTPEPVTAHSSMTPAPDPVVDPTAPRPGGERFAQWLSARGWAHDATSGEASEDPSSATGVHDSQAPLFATLFNSTSASYPARDPSETEAYRPSDATPEGAFVSSSEPVAVESTAPRHGSRGEMVAAASVGNLRLASEEDLAGIWEGDTIPIELLHGESRLVTPYVGNVRVVLKTGEIFDGRLYAIGQGQVWLESDLGRLALSAVRVQTVDVAAASDTKKLESLPRMRVRTPGGLFFGKVIARDEQRVTLMLDDGARIVLESTDVEPAPLAETRVVGPIKP